MQKLHNERNLLQEKELQNNSRLWKPFQNQNATENGNRLGTKNLQNYKTVQTDNGWIVSFNAVLYAEIDYTFTLEINDHSGATLTISNDWYNDVQYTGTISQVY